MSVVIAFRNPLFDSQLRRTIGHGTYGGAELGRFTADEGAGDHCVSGNRSLFHERVFDWLDAHAAQFSATRGE